MEPIRDVVTIVAAISAALAGIFSVVAVIVLLKYKTESLEKFEAEVKKDVRQISDKIADLITLVQVNHAEQRVINNYATNSIQGLVNRVERLEDKAEGSRDA